MANLSDSDFKRYKTIVLNGVANAELLNDNQFNFLTDYEARFEKYGKNTFVSEKQALYFEVIEEELQRRLGASYEE